MSRNQSILILAFVLVVNLGIMMLTIVALGFKPFIFAGIAGCIPPAVGIWILTRQ